MSVGTYVFGNGVYVESYFNNQAKPVGFGAAFDGEEYYMGMMSGTTLEGIGMRRIVEPVGTTIYATFTEGKLNGTAFLNTTMVQVSNNTLLTMKKLAREKISIVVMQFS